MTNIVNIAIMAPLVGLVPSATSAVGTLFSFPNRWRHFKVSVCLFSSQRFIASQKIKAGRF